jgi:hypothetical protein
LGISPAELDEWYLKDVLDLFEYWTEYPPAHLLLRALVGFEGSDKQQRRPSSARARRAREFGDDSYRPDDPSLRKETPMEAIGGRGTGAKHIDCAKPHIQQAIERMKKDPNWDVTKNG